MSSNKETIASLNRRYEAHAVRATEYESQSRRLIYLLKEDVPPALVGAAGASVILAVLTGLSGGHGVLVIVVFALLLWLALGVPLVLHRVHLTLTENRKILEKWEHSLDVMDSIGSKLQSRPAVEDSKGRAVWQGTNPKASCFRSATGKKKASYTSKKNAEREADRLNSVYEIKFHEYLCPNPECRKWHVGRTMRDRDESTS